jgi:heme/copper-type cytochrome/quinol oxidase subunit 2
VGGAPFYCTFAFAYDRGELRKSAEGGRRLVIIIIIINIIIIIIITINIKDWTL